MKPGIDLIVVNYRCPEDLRSFLGSLRSHPPTVPWSLVIANVCPTREDGEAAREFELPYDYIHFSQNVGYARAVNLAAQFGDRETIALFNADTKLTQNVVNEAHFVLHCDESRACVGPRQIDSQNRITAGGFFETGERGFHQINNDEIYGDVRDDATTISGSAYFVKRSVWRELTECPLFKSLHPGAGGAFLPTPLYFEDEWCSWHARAHGYKVTYLGTSTMIHEWNRAARNNPKAREALSISRKMFTDMCGVHENH